MECLFANHATRASPFPPSGLSRTKGRRKLCLRRPRFARGGMRGIHIYASALKFLGGCLCLSSPLPAILGHRACVYKRVQLSCNKKELLLEIKTIGVFMHFFPSALVRLVVREVIFENKIMEVTHASNNVCSCCIFSSSCLYCRREILSWETCLPPLIPREREKQRTPFQESLFCSTSCLLVAPSSWILPLCLCLFLARMTKEGI